MNSIKINKVMSFQSLFSFNNSNSPDLQIQNNYLPSQFIPITWLIFDPKKYRCVPKIDTFLVPPKIQKCVNLWDGFFLSKITVFNLWETTSL